MIIEKEYKTTLGNGTAAKIEIRVTIDDHDYTDTKKIISGFACLSHDFYLELASRLSNKP